MMVQSAFVVDIVVVVVVVAIIIVVIVIVVSVPTVAPEDHLEMYIGPEVASAFVGQISLSIEMFQICLMFLNLES